MVGGWFTAPAWRFAENLGIHILIVGEESVPVSVFRAPHLSHEAVAGNITFQFWQHDSQVAANIDHQALFDLEGREAARTMGLPERYKLPNNSRGYQVAGDGVAVPVVKF
jgi:hypothetical protein